MKIKYHVEGLDCPHCAARLEGMLANASGIDSAKINFLTEQITVESALSDSELDTLVFDIAKKFNKSTRVVRM